MPMVREGARGSMFPRENEEPEGSTGTVGTGPLGGGTPVEQDLKRVAACALGFLEVGDVEEAKRVLREGLWRARL